VRRKLIRAVAGIGLLGGLAGAEAQERSESEPVSLEAMQVTAGRASESAFDVPQPVTLLDGAEVDARSPQVMTEALRGEPGAFFQQSGPGQGIVVVRGLKGSEVLHLVDGMRLNNAFFRNSPSQYIALLDPQNVGQLELVRGPSATIYGSDAMGGVLQVLTPEYRFDGASLDWRGGGRVHYGSADLARTTRAFLATGSRAFSVSAGISYSDFGRRKLAAPGQSPDGQGGVTLEERVNDTEYLSRGYDVKALFQPGDAHELMLSFQQFEIPELQRYFQTVPGYTAGAPPRQVAQFMNERTFYHARYRYTQPLGFADRLELHVARQVMRDDRLDRNQTPRDEFTFNTSTLDGVTAQAETALSSQRLRYGVEIYRDEVRSSAYRENPPGSGSITYPNGTSFFSPFPDGSRADDYGAWLLDEIGLSAAWMLEAGARYTYHRTEIARGDRAFGATLTQDDMTGNLGLRYAITQDLAWTSNLGRGFRAPNLFDLALVGQRANNRVVVANLDLKPESVTSLDTGLKFRGAAVDAEFSVFYSDYDDRIVTVNPAFAEGTPECPDDGDPATTGCAQNQNIARSTYYGFEGGARWTPSAPVTLRTVLNYTWGEQEQNGVTDAANRVPPLNGQVGLEYRPWPCWSVEPWLFFADRQDRLDAGDRTDSRIDPNGTPGYAIFNLRGAWEPVRNTSLQLELRNLLDKRYREHGSGIDGAGLGVGVTAQVRFN
jgi:outer membrane receptor protein involved in Fe transport